MASRTSVRQPCRSAQRVYIRTRSPAKRADSSPPSPALTSSSASRSSSGSRGTSRRPQPLLRLGDGRLQRGRLGGEGGVLARQLARGGQVVAGGDSSRAAATVGPSAAKRLVSVRTSDWSAWTAGSARRARGRRTPPAARGPPAAHRSSHLLARRSLPRQRGTPVPAAVTAAGPASGGATWRRACRSGPRTGPRGHRCRGSSACPCRTGGTASTPRVDGAVALGAAGGERVATGAGHRVSTYCGCRSFFMRALSLGQVVRVDSSVHRREPDRRRSVPERGTLSQTRGGPHPIPVRSPSLRLCPTSPTPPARSSPSAVCCSAGRTSRSASGCSGTRSRSSRRTASPARPARLLRPDRMGDHPEVVAATRASYGRHAPDVELSVLTLFPQPSVPDVAAHLLAQDVVHVEGGSVANLMAVWRCTVCARCCAAAGRAGRSSPAPAPARCAGTSAGPTDSYGDALAPFTDGLGLLPFANGVHDDLADQPRYDVLRRLVADGTLPPATRRRTASGCTTSGRGCTRSSPATGRDRVPGRAGGRGGWREERSPPAPGLSLRRRRRARSARCSGPS